MVRSEGGQLFEDFKNKKLVAIGSPEVGDISAIKTLDELKTHYQSIFPQIQGRSLGIQVAFLFKFAHIFQTGDGVITYDPNERRYLVGEIVGDYEYNPKHKLPFDYPHIRKVKWIGEIKRDSLSFETRNGLGTLSTLFALNEQVWLEVQSAVVKKNDNAIPEADLLVEAEELKQIKETQKSEAFELLKDKINNLNPRQAEFLVAALLRAMGYKAKVTPVGPDRNLDVFASPDGLGFQDPIIKAEVKHQGKKMEAKEIRSFGATLKGREKGLFVSTGGFTKEAVYESGNLNIAVTLVDLESLANLVIEHYENFDEEGRKLIPLVRIYWPAE